jgi:hypothetical protein
MHNFSFQVFRASRGVFLDLMMPGSEIRSLAVAFVAVQPQVLQQAALALFAATTLDRIILV